MVSEPSQGSIAASAAARQTFACLVFGSGCLQLTVVVIEIVRSTVRMKYMRTLFCMPVEELVALG